MAPGGPYGKQANVEDVDGYQQYFGCGMLLPMGTATKSYRSINWPGDVLNHTVED